MLSFLDLIQDIVVGNASGSKSVPVEPLSDVITERDSTKPLLMQRSASLTPPLHDSNGKIITLPYNSTDVRYKREMGFLPRVKERASFCGNLQKEQPSSRAHNLLIYHSFHHNLSLY